MSTNKPDDNLPLAMALALLTALFIAAMNLFGKLLGESFDALEITFLRNIAALVLLVIVLAAIRNLHYMKTQRPLAQGLRAICGTLGIFFGFWACTLMPLADATALMFTQPLWVVLLSYPLLKERVGPLRIAAVVVGFTGVLIMTGPSGGEHMSPFNITIGLLAGFFSATVAICLRWLGKTEPAYTTVFYFLAIGAVLTFIPLPFMGSAIPTLDISSAALPLIAGLGFFGVSSLLVKTYSYRLGDAALVTPVSYTMIIWAGLFDYILWGRVPTLAVLGGSSLIIASNLFILWRENKKNKRVINEDVLAGE